MLRFEQREKINLHKFELMSSTAIIRVMRSGLVEHHRIYKDDLNS